MTRKRCEIGQNLLIVSPITGFRSVPKSVTLSDLERPSSRHYAFFHTIRQLWGGWSGRSASPKSFIFFHTFGHFRAEAIVELNQSCMLSEYFKIAYFLLLSWDFLPSDHAVILVFLVTSAHASDVMCPLKKLWPSCVLLSKLTIQYILSTQSAMCRVICVRSFDCLQTYLKLTPYSIHQILLTTPLAPFTDQFISRACLATIAAVLHSVTYLLSRCPRVLSGMAPVL